MTSDLWSLSQVQRLGSSAGLLGGDESSWGSGGGASCRKGTISQYFSTLHCPVCQQLTQLGVCGGCRGDAQRVAVTLQQDLRTWESQQEALLKVSRGWGQPVTPSISCAILYRF